MKASKRSSAAKPATARKSATAKVGGSRTAKAVKQSKARTPRQPMDSDARAELVRRVRMLAGEGLSLNYMAERAELSYASLYQLAVYLRPTISQVRAKAALFSLREWARHLNELLTR